MIGEYLGRFKLCRMDIRNMPKYEKDFVFYQAKRTFKGDLEALRRLLYHLNSKSYLRDRGTTLEERRKTCELSENGYSAEEISELMGVHVNTVRHRIRKHTGSGTMIASERCLERGNKVRELRVAGYSYREIARKLGCAEGSISNYLREG